MQVSLCNRIYLFKNDYTSFFYLLIVFFSAKYYVIKSNTISFDVQ
jgi:hypothetical protein